MNAKDKQNEAELRKNPINEFTCCGKKFLHKEFVEHLLKEHGLVPDKIKGTKQMLSHIDGTYWYSFNYQWKLDTGLGFTQYTMQARAKNDPMRY